MFDRIKRTFAAISEANSDLNNSTIFNAAEKVGNTVKNIYTSSPADAVGHLKSGAVKVKDFAVKAAHTSPAEVTADIISLPKAIKSKVTAYAFKKATGMDAGQFKQLQNQVNDISAQLNGLNG